MTAARTSVAIRTCAARVPFFFKQWGGVQKGKYGRLLDGRTYDEMPAQAMTPIPSREERRALARTLEPLVQRSTVIQVQPVPALKRHANG